MTCPRCSGRALKVILYGLPMRLCEDERCSCLFGFWSSLIMWGVLPPSPAVFVYDGPYVDAFIAWWRDTFDD